MLPTNFENPARHRRAVAGAINLPAGTPRAPQPDERYPLALFQRGVLALAEVEELLRVSVYQVLYHSRATTPPSEAQLQALLDWARPYNAAHQATGLLLYRQGCYVQVLEGPAADVRTLFARIRATTRHARVVGERAAAPAVDQVLDVLQTQTPGADLAVEDPPLQALLTAFGAHPLAAEVAPVAAFFGGLTLCLRASA